MNININQKEQAILNSAKEKGLEKINLSILYWDYLEDKGEKEWTAEEIEEIRASSSDADLLKRVDEYEAMKDHYTMALYGNKVRWSKKSGHKNKLNLCSDESRKYIKKASSIRC